MRNRMMLFLIPILLALASVLLPGCVSATDQVGIERLDDGLGVLQENSQAKPGVDATDYANAWSGARGISGGLRQRYAKPPTATATPSK